MIKPTYLENESDRIFGDANRIFLEEGFSGLLKVVKSKIPDLEVNVWNEEGIVVAIRPVSGELRLDVKDGAKILSSSEELTNLELKGNRQYVRIYHHPKS